MTNSWILLFIAEIAIVFAVSATTTASGCNQDSKPPPKPTVSNGNVRFLEGETFSINCTVPYTESDLVSLEWKYPPYISADSIIVTTNEHNLHRGTLYKNISIINATKEHAGIYSCESKNNCEVKKVDAIKNYTKNAFLDLKADYEAQPVDVITKKAFKLKVSINDYPTADFYFLFNNKSLAKNITKYKIERDEFTGDAILTIKNLLVNDTGNYTIVANNGYLTKSLTVDLRIIKPPTAVFRTKGDLKYQKNSVLTLQCDVTGYPLPAVYWIFSNGEEKFNTSSALEKISLYKAIARIDIPVQTSQEIMCKAINSRGNANDTRKLLVYEIKDGFGIKNSENMTWFSQRQNVTLTCIASIYDFKNVTWVGENEEDLSGTVEYKKSPFSLIANLKLPRISIDQSGVYTCRGVMLDGAEQDETINITIAATQSPIIAQPTTDNTEEVYPRQRLQLNCLAQGVPLPNINWYKDGKLVKNDGNLEIRTIQFNRTMINSTISITEMKDEYKGEYECVADSDGVVAQKIFSLIYKEPSYVVYSSAVIVVIFILLTIVIYLTFRIKKEQKFRKELAKAGLSNFKKGALGSINPEMGINEQAELLPYDEKFEFPPDKLFLGKQLGSGAFGVVYKAEARGIINAEKTTVVAVKMVKKDADNMFIKALASELKIMVHLGKHINIVNLLGACTKNVGKRELSVIVEYCKFGNIHNYMQRHREVFIDQLTDDADNKEKNLGKINRGFSCSSGTGGGQSDYFGGCNTQQTDHTLLSTASTNKSTRTTSGGYLIPDWRSNYESDYSYEGRSPRPLSSRDLLAWAFQIASGMEYLANRKVLHGDLAARNILLAEDNVVKICDFGLARSIYKNEEYLKTGDSLLPVKWLAIECITDRIFSTQSDVWSFGIVLWELFSLAKTPYPDVAPSDLLAYLSAGKRMVKPRYSDDKLYDVMQKCWQQRPTARPSFSELQKIIGGFLEDNVRNYYVDLNASNIDINAQLGHEDYLAMVSAPDYNNLVTPSPHHYINEVKKFFPSTPTQLDEDGYLKMTPGANQVAFKPNTDTFDFETRKLNPRVSEASSCGSELTPMLTLNNLPARNGSESDDHEGSTSPCITMCPTIDEEADEVFEVKQNNEKNVMNTNSAVTNPTYTTLDGNNDIIHLYVNMTSLVK